MAWTVHLFTTMGVVVGMLALQAVFDRNPERAIWFLLATQIIDGIDGPMARQVNVKTVVPKIDGYVLDLVIDYVTCVVVPAAFMHQFDLLPDRCSLPLVGAIVFFSAMWFSRTDMMTDDLWFNGFPATWNLVAPTMLLTSSAPWFNAAIVVILCALMMTDVQFPHVMRSVRWRVPTIVMTVVWLGSMFWATVRLPDQSVLGTTLLTVCVCYFAVLSVVQTLRRVRRPAFSTQA
jgi:phosphatidylcholine synthase